MDSTTLELQNVDVQTQIEEEEVVFDYVEAKHWLNVPLSLDFYREIPIEAEWAITVVVFIFGNLLNVLVVQFYRKVKSSIRPYVLFLAFIDLVSISFIMMPRIVLRYLPVGTTLYVVRILLYALMLLFYNVQMYGPLFLALDRFLVVSFPHNFRDKQKFAKIPIVVLPTLHVITSICVVILQVFADSTSMTFFLVSNLNNCFKMIQIFGCLSLYAIVVVKIMLNERKMADSKHAGAPQSGSRYVRVHRNLSVKTQCVNYVSHLLYIPGYMYMFFFCFLSALKRRAT